MAATSNANSAPRGREVQDAVRTHPAQQLNGQVREKESQVGHVMAGIDDDQDGRVTDLALACHIQPLENIPGLGGGDGDRVVPRTQPDHVQHGSPRRPPRLQSGIEGAGHPGFICAEPLPRPYV